MGHRRRIVHKAQCKPWVAPIVGEQWPLHFKRLTDEEETPAAMDEWEVEKVLEHRRTRDGRGLEFLTKWRGYGPEECTWEPARNFLQRVNVGWLQYCKRQKLDFTVMQHLEHLLHNKE